MKSPAIRVLILFIAFCSFAFATEPDPLRFQTQMKQEVGSWATNMQGPVTRLFWLLVTLDFSWSSIQLALRACGLEEFASTIIKKLFFYGFAVLLLTNGTDYARAVIESFIQLAGIAASAPADNPITEIWDYAFRAIEDLYTGMESYTWLTQAGLILLNGFTILGMAIICAYISILLILAFCEAYIVISLSLILLAFNGSNYTSEYGRKFLHFSMLAGLKLFASIILAYLGIVILREWAWTFRSSSVANIVAGTVCFGIYAVLVQKIPGVFVNVVSGGGLGGSSESIGAQAVKMAAVGAMAAATGGIAATGAAANLAKAQGATDALGLAGRTAKNLAKSFAEDLKGSFGAKSLDEKSQPSMGHRMALRMDKEASSGELAGKAAIAETLKNSISQGEGNAPSTGSVSNKDEPPSGSTGGNQPATPADPRTAEMEAQAAEAGGAFSRWKGDEYVGTGVGTGAPSALSSGFTPPAGTAVQANSENAMSGGQFDPTGDNMGTSQGDSAGQISNASGSAAPVAPQIRNSGAGTGAPAGPASGFTPPTGTTVQANSGKAMSSTQFDPTGDNMGTSKGDSAGQISNASGSAAPTAPQIRNSGAGTGAPAGPASGFTPPTGTKVQANSANAMSGGQIKNSDFDPTGDNVTNDSPRMEKLRREFEEFKRKQQEKRGY